MTRMNSSVNNNCASYNKRDKNSNNNDKNKNNATPTRTEVMSNTKNCSTMNLHFDKMKSQDINPNGLATGTAATTSPTPSPPDFDFNLPCRYFKSSFARSLSLNSAVSSHCRSLDYDSGHGSRNNSSCHNKNENDLGNNRKANNNNNNNSGSNSSNNNCNVKINHGLALPQRLSRATASMAATLSTSAESNILPNSINIVAKNEGAPCPNSCSSSNKLPAMPQTRRMSAASAGYNLELPEQQQQPQKQQQQNAPLTQFRPASNASTHLNKINNHKKQQQQQQQQQHHQYDGDNGNGNGHDNNNSNKQKRRNIVWPKDGDVASEQDFELSDEAADLEITAISANGNELMVPPTEHHQWHSERQNQRHQQQQQQQQQPRSLYTTREEAVNVEAVLLQNQVDTLQWQLKQVETSCEMYRAVMEEVARFLDRYHTQKQRQSLDRNSKEQITRSKSMHHVYGVGEGGIGECHYDDDNDAYERPTTDCSHAATTVAARLRTRSSTNLLDSPKQEPPPQANKLASKKPKPAKGCVDDHLYELIAPAKNYNDFKDYTWRRSPKKLRELNALCSESDVEEKLNQEAFRLSRTIHNLLNTSLQQPDLTQHRSSYGTVSVGHLRKAPTTSSSSSSITTLNQSLLNTTALTRDSSDSFICPMEGVGTKSHNLATTAANSSTVNAAELIFLRSANMRDSRLSLRSSTDSSVHSTSSSSKLETDEEHSPFPPPPHALSAPKSIPQLSSTTEDESGFSSISSFQDIGVPLSSTMISARHSLPNAKSFVNEFMEASASEPNTLGSLDLNVDSRNSTLKAATLPPLPPPTPTPLPHAVGVPLHSSCELPPQRWDSSSKAYRTFPNKFQQRFSTLSNDDSAAVLWV